jgi:SAM-dependent methyltransferase
MPQPATGDRSHRFREIYNDHLWAGQSRSGSGSDPAETAQYRAFLSQFMAENAVRSVVDLGCGDWTSTKLVDWTAIDYRGIDIVPELIAANRAAFGSDHIHFDCGDLVETDLGQADLCICKDVLQHLPTSDVQAILAKLPAFRFALLTNDWQEERQRGWRSLWRWQALGNINGDIRPGGHRPLRLREPPFSLQAERVLAYTVTSGRKRWYKEVLLWRRLPRAST